MARILYMAYAASLALVCFGCANIVMRTPISREPIDCVYKPTREQALFTAMCACPQVFLSPTGGFYFCVENVFTIPLAIVPAADLVVEAVLDTVFLPVDWPLAAARQKKTSGNPAEETKE